MTRSVPARCVVHAGKEMTCTSHDAAESLSDLLAAILVAEWRRQHNPPCNPQEDVTMVPENFMKSTY